MPVLTPMTFRELMQEYGILKQVELCRRTGLAKQYVSALWNQKLNIGRGLAERLSQQLGIPLERLTTLDWVQRPRQRGPGRPRKDQNKTSDGVRVTDPTRHPEAGQP